MPQSYTFGSQNLNDNVNYFLLSKNLDFPEVKESLQKLAHLDGMKSTGVNVNERTINLKIGIISNATPPTRADLEAKIDALDKVLALRQQSLQLHALDSRTFTADCISAKVTLSGSSPVMAVMDATFLCAVPYASAASASTQSIGLTLYGSATADATLTNACDMSNTTGGTETSKTTTITGTNVYAEVLSQGGTAASVASIPGTPTGKGWVYQPGSSTIPASYWNAIVTLSAASTGGSTHTDVTIRFFKYSSGTYTSIGTINTAITGTSKTTYTFTATSMSSVTFGSSDLLYVDLWWHNNNSNAGGNNPVVYVATASSAGVTNDMQIMAGSALSLVSGNVYQYNNQSFAGGGTATSLPTIHLVNTTTVAWTQVQVIENTDNRTLTITSNLPSTSGDYLDIYCDPNNIPVGGYSVQKNGTTGCAFNGVFAVQQQSTTSWTIQVTTGGSAPAGTALWTWTPRFMR